MTERLFVGLCFFAAIPTLIGFAWATSKMVERFPRMGLPLFILALSTFLFFVGYNSVAQ